MSDNLKNDETSVPVPKSRYEDLLRSEAMLEALRASGVDNWDGYDFAIDDYHDNLKKIGLDDDD